MTPGEFLRLLWPETGPYCIAHPYKPGEKPNIHRTFDTISQAVTHVHELAGSTDVFFTVLSLREHKVWEPEKVDYKTGEKGAWAVRPHRNIAAGKAVFFDLDVGDDPAKYPTQRDALAALGAFLIRTKLPQPTVISSGNGAHVYWHFDQTLPVDEWREIALHMRQLAEGLKVRIDVSRTTDSASILRVPDTYNWKTPTDPKLVRVLGDQRGAITPVATFRQMLSDAMIREGITAATPDSPRASAPAPGVPVIPGLAPQEFNDFGPPLTLGELGDVCAQVRKIIRSQTDSADPDYGKLDQTAWYRGMLATLRHVEGGNQLCTKLTALFPRRTSVVADKLVQLQKYAPATCATLQDIMPWKDAPCQGCQFRDKVANPFVAARKLASAPPPGQTTVPPPPPPAPTATMQTLVAPNLAIQQASIPNPPKPYTRMKGGGISITRTDKDGNQSVSMIYEHDLYPLKRLENKGDEKEQHVWRVTLPRSGSRDFTMDADTLYDMRKFCVSIAHNGLFPNKADLSNLQDYMVAYISQLQKTVDADVQTSHLGWSKDYKQFILPDKTLMADGTVQHSSLSVGVQRAAQHITRAGTPEAQRGLLHFFNHPEYVANQFVIVSGLASIIFDMTGHHGIVINCSGDAGASKSTTMYTAASVWGNPILWPINGTAKGATANARAQRIMVNSNLPTCVDEVTHMQVRDANDMVMGITQPGHRLRLDQTGAERRTDDSVKSAVMICTANSSLHSIISQDSTAGTAGSMRVFEIKFTAQSVHTKAEADEYLRALKENYGHLGEAFAHFVICNRDRVAKRVHQVMRDVDARCNIKSSERFWSAIIAAVYVAAEIAKALNILPYDPEALLDWATGPQMRHMRGVVTEEYRTPVDVLTNYIAEKQGHIMVIDRQISIGANTSGKNSANETAFAIVRPHGALLGHYDLKTQSLILLKSAFRDYCVQSGSSATRILEELNATGYKVVTDRNARRTLGAGTDLAKGQAWCFVVDMTHPDIAGAAPTLVASGGAPTTAPAGNLHAVKP